MGNAPEYKNAACCRVFLLRRVLPQIKPGKAEIANICGDNVDHVECAVNTLQGKADDVHDLYRPWCYIGSLFRRLTTACKSYRASFCMLDTFFLAAVASYNMPPK